MLVRIRIPGGRISAGRLQRLAMLAAEYGQPELQITSRGNVQLRGIDADRLADLSDAVTDLGLLPSPDHERVRNIVGSALAGLGGRPAVSSVITELDQAICADPELVGLPSRFLFAVDDGSGDVAGLRFDLAARWLSEDRWLIVAGTAVPRAKITDRAGVVPEMIMVARRFLALRKRSATPPWHLHETNPDELDPTGLLDGWSALEELIATAGPLVRSGPTPLGAIDGAASVSVPLARLTSRQIDVLATAAGAGEVVLTPWRGVVVPGAADRLDELAAVGLIVDDHSAWNGLTACVGAPGCGKSMINTREFAAGLAAVLDDQPGLPIHISGCGRRCGTPSGPHHDLVAPDDLDRAIASLGGVAS
ncbi:precorrin-3B synthase [Microlunatus endophyticus]|uniref:Precorrin-3B synthase n=2 Tax=Microlunatus endophyticus TaxID=1716077 RepID=A0A917S6P0_9ACTN|nr:precorrin-3B synthase [Microlunatus endophyticus]